MFHHRSGIQRFAVLLGVAALVALGSATTLRSASGDPTALTVVVTDAETGKPIYQARLTLRFPEPGKLRPKVLTYSAKTDSQGRCKFTQIPSGKVTLMVTDEHHQTFGKQFDVDAEHATIEVKLKKPHPML